MPSKITKVWKMNGLVKARKEEKQNKTKKKRRKSKKLNGGETIFFSTQICKKLKEI